MGAKYIQFTLGTTDEHKIEAEFAKRQERDYAKGRRKDPEYHSSYPLDWAGMSGPVHCRLYEGVYRSMDAASRAVSHRRNDTVAL